MTNAHTPGPWHIGVRQPTSDKFIYCASGGEIADCDRQLNFPHENLANARLIAAAPDLLSLVKELADRLDTGNAMEAPLWNQCQNAIAKATA